MSFGLVKHNNNSISAITTPGSLTQGKLTLIKEQTASSSSSISFVDGSGGVVLDSTYPIYVFKYINIHPATDNVAFQYNGSTDGGSNYNVTKTSTSFLAYHKEDDTDTAFYYSTGGDLAQSTSFKSLVLGIGNANDEQCCGELTLFNPSSTTFVKHWLSHTPSHSYQSYIYDWWTAGYMNTTSAVNGIQFKMSSGNIDSGTIKLYGIKGS